MTPDDFSELFVLKDLKLCFVAASCLRCWMNLGAESFSVFYLPYNGLTDLFLSYSMN